MGAWASGPGEWVFSGQEGVVEFAEAAAATAIDRIVYNVNCFMLGFV